MTEIYTCPECGSDQVTVAHIQTFMVNTGDHYCHSVKTQDSDSTARCIACDWNGERYQLSLTYTDEDQNND